MVATIYYEFGPFSVDPIKRVLLQGNKRLPLAAKPFDLLIDLIQNAGQPVSKELLMEHVWGETEVSDNTFNVTLSSLRKALGESAKDRQYIVTRPNGYCFIGEIKTILIGEVQQSIGDLQTDKLGAESKQEPLQSVSPKERVKEWIRKPWIIMMATILLCVAVFSLIPRHDRLPIQASSMHSNAQIVVDGHPHEWAGISPLLTDPIGDGPFNPYGQYYQGEDFINISVTNDSTNLYFLLEFAGDFSGGIKLFLDTDLDVGTGCNGAEYIIFVSTSAPGANLDLADGRNCTFKDDFPGAVRSEMRGRFAEASVSIASLRIITPQTRGVRVSAEALAPGKGVSDTVGPPATYLFE